MPVDAGSVVSELTLNTSQYDTAIQKAERQMQTFEQAVAASSRKMEQSLGLVDKQMRLWELTTSGATRALQAKGVQVDSIKQKMSLLEQAISETNAELQASRDKFGGASEEARLLENQLLDLKIQHAELNKELEKFSLSSTLQEAGKKATQLGTTLTTRVTLPLLGVAGAATKVSMNFEAGMSRVSAISGATGDDLERLEGQALELGAKTAFSAGEAAAGMENLASAGFTVAEIMDAMPGMLDLAAAGGVEIAEASDIASAALRGFSLEASQAGHVADVLARAAGDTNAGIIDLGYAMKYVAPIASAMGLSIEEVSAAIGLMSNAGIKGEQAGTTLRASLTRLANPTAEASQLMQSLGINAFDTEGRMRPLTDVVQQLLQGTANLTEQQRQQSIATIFGTEAMSGMLALMAQGPDELERLADSFVNSEGAADQMARTMQDNLKGSIEEMKGSLETAGIQIGGVLTPMIRDAAKWITEMTNKFAALNPETQKTIVKTAALVAAAGPLLIVGGKIAGGLSSIIKFAGILKGGFAALTGATKLATAATAVSATTTAGLTGGLGAAGLAAKAGALLLNPWTLGLAAAGVAGYALHKNLSQELIPTIDLFGSEVSKSTQEAVSAFMEMSDAASLELAELSLTGQAVTSEMTSSIVGKFAEMANQVDAGLDQHHDESVFKMEQFFARSQGLTEQEQSEMLASMQEHHEQQKVSVAEKETRIKEILTTASAEKRALTRDERDEINRIQQEMKENAVRVLSENEVEAKVILERMKAQAEDLTARQAAEVAKNSAKQRDDAIAAAETQYSEVISTIVRQRDEAGTISAEQADKLISEATRQRDEAVARAMEMHQMVVNEAKLQAKEHVDAVDWETGEIKTKWQSLVDSAKSFFGQIGDAIGRALDKLGEWTGVSGSLPPVHFDGGAAGFDVGQNALGTNYWRGGLTWVGEQGPELIELPRGSKVYTNQESERMASKPTINQTNNFYSPKALTPSETARKNQQVSRQLAMEWGL